MDLLRLLYVCYIFFFQIVVSITLLIMFVIYFPYDECLERISIFVLLMLVIRLDKCIAFVSIYFKKSAFEFEATIIASLIYLLNAMEGDCSDSESIFSIICKIIFYGVFFANCLAYLYSFLVVFFFGLMILIILLRGGQNNMGLQLDSRGLNVDQMTNIEEKTYLQLKEENPGIINHAPNGQNMQNEQNNLNNSHALINIDPQNQNQNQPERNENEKVCSICLSEFQDQEMVCKLPECNHIFHSECIKEWLVRNHICPFCRNDIKKSLRRIRRAQQGVRH